MDQNKKTMRHFYCRDVLWETFEQMANDFDCSIAYLINESMRFYARSKNYQGGARASSSNLPVQAPPQPAPSNPNIRTNRPTPPPAPPPTRSTSSMPAVPPTPP